MLVLAKLVKFELPSSLLEAEANQIAHQLWHEENPDVEGHDHPEIETTDEHTKLAVRRVRLGLLLAEVGNIKEITVSDTERQQAVIQQSQQYGSNAQQFFEYVQKNPQVQQQIRAPLFEEKVVDHIVSVAKMTDNEVTKEELQKYFPNELCSTVIPRNIKLAEAPSSGKPGLFYDPKAKGTVAYLALAGEVISKFEKDSMVA